MKEGYMTPARIAARIERLKKSLTTPESYNTKKRQEDKKKWSKTKKDGLPRY